MAKLKDRLADPAGWTDLIMGNWAVARAMIDSGTRVVTTFPGSPTPEIAAALELIPKADRSFYFEYSANEKVALEIAAGASLNGHLSAVFFKSVGLNVASDSLIQQSMMQLIGGMIVILGDDPGANSSQNEQDNRAFARMSYIPMFEPATPQETYDMYHEAVALARRLSMPVFLRMTTHVNHAREMVTVRPRDPAPPDWTPRFDAANGPYVPITKHVFPLKRRALEKLEQVREVAETTSCNAVLDPNRTASSGGKRLGIVSAALPAMAALEVLTATGTPVDILKLGLSYPLPRRKIASFLAQHDEVLVLEELDPVMETEIKAIAWETGSKTTLRARTKTEQLMGELGPRRVRELLAETWPEVFSAPEPLVTDAIAAVPRAPQMCPGCGHRSAFHAVKAALEADSITVADIGCHSLGFLPPYEMGKVLFSMGHGVSTASGMAIGNEKRKVVTFIGDSTLLHAGLPGIVNAAAHDHDIVLILMDNGTTAMTGHQPRFGSGEEGQKLPFKPLLEALGVKFIRECDTYSQAQLTAHIREAMAHEGFAIVIARHPCMLKMTRDQKRKNPGFKLPPVKIDQGVCDKRHVCAAEFGCPSFVRAEDGTITVHEDLCIGDGSCLQTCPVHAIVRQPRPGGAS
jgi:indolepyruvate ferredoxin oxidoreductase, alpha subunit